MAPDTPSRRKRVVAGCLPVLLLTDADLTASVQSDETENFAGLLWFQPYFGGFTLAAAARPRLVENTRFGSVQFGWARLLRATGGP